MLSLHIDEFESYLLKSFLIYLVIIKVQYAIKHLLKQE